MCFEAPGIVTWQRERETDIYMHVLSHFAPREHILSAVPFFGSSSLGILLGGEANSSSLKGNLLMPELLQGQTHAHKSMLKSP